MAIVTGSTRGIGEAIARMLTQHQVKVVINSVASLERGKAIASELKDSIYCQADIGSETDCKRLVETAIHHYGRLDFLINNAGKPGRLLGIDINEITIVVADGGYSTC